MDVTKAFNASALSIFRQPLDKAPSEKGWFRFESNFPHERALRDSNSDRNTSLSHSIYSILVCLCVCVCACVCASVCVPVCACNSQFHGPSCQSNHPRTHKRARDTHRHWRKAVYSRGVALTAEWCSSEAHMRDYCPEFFLIRALRAYRTTHSQEDEHRHGRSQQVCDRSDTN